MTRVSLSTREYLLAVILHTYLLTTFKRWYIPIYISKLDRLIPCRSQSFWSEYHRRWVRSHFESRCPPNNIFSYYGHNGDDCISVINGGKDIIAQNGYCGFSSHGLSIGSLGKNGAVETVQNVLFKNWTMDGAVYGARVSSFRLASVRHGYLPGSDALYSSRAGQEANVLRIMCHGRISHWLVFLQVFSSHRSKHFDHHSSPHH